MSRELLAQGNLTSLNNAFEKRVVYGFHNHIYYVIVIISLIYKNEWYA